MVGNGWYKKLQRLTLTTRTVLFLIRPIDNSFAIISPYLHGIYTKSYNSDAESHGTVFSPPHPGTVRKLHLYCGRCSGSSVVDSRRSCGYPRLAPSSVGITRERRPPYVSTVCLRKQEGACPVTTDCVVVGDRIKQY